MGIRWLMVVSVAAVLGGSVPAPAIAQDVPGDYIVVLQDAAVDRAGESGIAGLVSATADRHGGRVGRTFRSVVRGYSASMSEKVARQVAADPNVAHVERDQVVRAAWQQTNPPS